jgi:hypothetical protein
MFGVDSFFTAIIFFRFLLRWYSFLEKIYIHMLTKEYICVIIYALQNGKNKPIVVFLERDVHYEKTKNRPQPF